MTNHDDSRNRDGQTRRSVLKTAAGLGVLTVGLGSSADLAAADPNKFDRGTVHFVEVKEEYPNVPTGPEISRHGTAGYVVEPEKSRLTLTNSPIDAFTTGGAVIAADGEYYESSVSFPVTKSKYHLPVETDYRHLKNRYVALNQERDIPKVTVTRADGAIQVNGDMINVRVPDGQDVEVASQQVSVTPAAANESVSLQQQIQVRNHGQVTLFGHEDYLIFPLNSSDSYAQARVESLLALAQGQLSKIEEADLLAVPKDLEVSTGGNGGE